MPLFVHEYYDTPSQKNIENGWWEYRPETGKVYNRNGGWHNFSEHPMQEFKEGEWPDIIAMTIRDDSLLTGWIAPDGEWYGCESTEHVSLANYLLKTSERDLEERGWIKVTEIPWYLHREDPTNWPNRYEYYHFSNTHRITKAQEKTLADHGLELKPYDIRHNLE